MGAFQPQFKPVVAPREHLELTKSEGDVVGYFRVTRIEPLQEKTHNFGTINSGATTGKKEITDLYMPTDELAQYRCYVVPPADLEVTVSQPKAKTRFTGKNYTHKITSHTPLIDPTLKTTELFVWEDEKIWFDVENRGQKNMPLCRLRFIGWRYALKELTEKPGVYTSLPVEGF